MVHIESRLTLKFFDKSLLVAVAEAARRPNVKIAPLKTVEQQGMQAIQRSRELLVQQHPGCRRLMELEGVGPISAVLLYATLGTGEAFANGRQFSAYVPC